LYRQERTFIPSTILLTRCLANALPDIKCSGNQFEEVESGSGRLACVHRLGLSGSSGLPGSSLLQMNQSAIRMAPQAAARPPTYPKKRSPRISKIRKRSRLRRDTKPAKKTCASSVLRWSAGTSGMGMKMDVAVSGRLYRKCQSRSSGTRSCKEDSAAHLARTASRRAKAHIRAPAQPRSARRCVLAAMLLPGSHSRYVVYTFKLNASPRA